MNRGNAEEDNSAVRRIDNRTWLLSSILEQCSEGLAMSDLEGNLLFANSAFADLHGYTPAEIVGKHLSIFHTPEQMPSVDAANRQILEKEEFNGEIWHVRRDGTVFPTLMHNSLLRDDHGTPIGMIGTMRDITQPKKSEEALRQSESRYRVTIDALPEALHVVDLNLRILLFNTTMEQWNRDLKLATDMIGRTVPEVFPFLPRRVRDEYRRVIETRKTLITNESLRIGDRDVATEVRKIPIVQKGEVAFVVTLIQDITERKQAEEALLRASRMEATATLARGIAHDFNNLMVGVLGNAELLAMQPGHDAKAKAMLSSIAKSAQRAGELAQQLLAFARGGKYQPRVMNLNNTVQETIELQGWSHPSRITIECDTESSLWGVKADPVQMGQVVMNLCLNAVEAIEDTGRIVLTTRNVEIDEERAASEPTLRAGRWVYLAVEDTGCGMEEETAAKAFEPFFSTKLQGRGLGLAAAYGIIRNHEGYIAIDSKEGRGTTFRVYLPATEAVPQTPVVIPHAIPRGTETILVIDDEKEVLQVSQTILEALGYRVLVAHSGEDALDITRGYGGEIHLALLDMGMPRLNGSEAFALIRRARPQIKVIICSGYELDAASRTLLEEGARGFIQKPFSVDVLGGEVRRVLDA